MSAHHPKPWYRQFWPWFLILIPGSAVLASIATVILAMRNPDGLVVDDYYRQGLAINRVLERDRRARTLGLAARVRLEPAAREVHLTLQARAGTSPRALRLRLIHPTRANMDREIRLHSTGEDEYAGRIDPLEPGNWHVQLEPGDGAWRLTGRLRAPGPGRLRLIP
ncbi:MAG: FixH family protein [Gammaproteobacteria bacterium]|nr:FixH family protein [Gammaproteobacteria bacterium]NIR97548.1 FixH family protein [Gammaproteobacteria bacterium]NIT63186.1 FixH family protein [Gammaproteobacteria bacterium]NIV20134.1 hypothetical protein [Gammaproteobacteria bacterium]NIX10470.1 hypothetical protein [Gammaproteobacteria bacterium]